MYDFVFLSANVDKPDEGDDKNKRGRAFWNIKK